MDLGKIRAALEPGGTERPVGERLFAEARNQLQWETIKQAPFYQSLLEELRNETRVLLEQALPVLPYSLFKLFWETGSRKEYEALYFARRARLNNLALLTLIEGEQRYLKALEDTIWAICDEYTWCLPAHLPDPGTVRDGDARLSRYEQGVLTQKVRPAQQVVDLFAAETAFALAEILSLLAARLAPEVVCRGRAEVFRRVLEPYQTLNSLLWWETAPMNWAAVCAGSIGAAALYLIEDEAVLAPLLHRVLATLELFLSGFAPDGACTEGIGYWTYGFGFYVYFASLLRDRTAGKLDLFQQEKLKAIALFQQQCYLTQNYVVSFSDAPVIQNFQLGLTHFLKRRYPEVQLPEPQYRAGFAEDTGRRWAHAVRDLIWADPGLESGLSVSGTTYLPDAQWLIVKYRAQGKTVCFAAKGGHNGEPHNHNDIGSFLLHVAGETLLADLGRGEYTRQYFQEAQRYQYLCTSSRGHSVPLIGEACQKAGREYAATEVAVTLTPGLDQMRLELAAAYDLPELQSLVRQFVVEKGEPTRLKLTDHFRFGSMPLPITERLVAYYRPELIAPGRVRVKGIKSCLDLVFDPQLLQYRLQQEVMVTHAATRQDIFLIDFAVRVASLELLTEIILEIN